MNSRHDEVRRRRIWIQLYAETKDAGLVCRRCGITRPTLRLWWRRFETQGDAGLISLSRRPHHSPRRVLVQERINLILALRDERKLGPKRIQAELLRHHDVRLSTARSGMCFGSLRERRSSGRVHLILYGGTAVHCLGIGFSWIR